MSWVSEVTADAPIGWWRLGEQGINNSAGTAVNAGSAGAPGNGSFSTSPGYHTQVFGLVDGDATTCMLVDDGNTTGGRIDAVNIAAFDIQTALTIEGITQPVDIVRSNPGSLVVGLGSATVNTGFFQTVFDGSLNYEHFTTGTKRTVTTAPNIVEQGQRAHVMMTRDAAGTAILFYVDGEAVTPIGSPTASAPTSNTSPNIAIAHVRGATGGASVSAQYMQESLLYNTTLSAARALAHAQAYRTELSCLAPPLIRTTSSSNSTGATTNKVMTWPAGIQAGDFVLLCFGDTGNNPVVSVVGGGTWTALATTFSGTATTGWFAWYGPATGAEAGTFTVNITAAARASGQFVVIDGTTCADFTTTPPEISPAFGAGTQFPDPRFVLPSWGTTYDALYLAMVSHATVLAAPTPPRNYALSVSSSAGGFSPSTAIAARARRIAGENPYIYTYGSSAGSVTATVAIRAKNPVPVVANGGDASMGSGMRRRRGLGQGQPLMGELVA